MGKLKRKNPKTKIVQLKKAKKQMFRVPVDGFIEIDDPNYEIDDLLGCY